MNLTKEQKQLIIEKQSKLESIKPILKSEFKGIDDVIDQIIESLRPFYIFPQSLKRPLIINLWGMTGTGKTSLANRIVELLELKHQYIQFDVGEYAYNTSEWKLRYDLSDKASNCANKNIVLAFDEFQLGRTIDEDRKEIDRSCLRPIWEVIDSGTIVKFAERKRVNEILQLIARCADQGVVIKNGIVTEGESIYNSIMQDYSIKRVDFAELDEAAPKNLKEMDDYDAIYDQNKIKYFHKPFFVKHWMFEELYSINPKFFNLIFDFEVGCKKFRAKNQSVKDVYNLILEHFIMLDPVMLKEDYSQSLIFIIGNIDEAYAMTHVIDPDSDADLLHEWSLKITTPKIKDALSNRYRMEQISRLGNNHIIYPAFNRKTYEEIISLNLSQRINYFEKEFGINLIFDKSVNDIIYKEGVFPTQGTRPVLSSISQLIDSYIALFISEIALKAPETTEVAWSFDDNTCCFKIEAKHKKKALTFVYPVKLNLEKLRQSDYSQQQAKTAIHEAGHAISSIVVGQIMPLELRSKTAGLANGFASIKKPDCPTYDSDYKYLVTLLSGLEAEKLIFGDEQIGTGGSSDLETATRMATQMIKGLGMGTLPYQVSIEDNGPYAIYGQEYNEAAEKQVVRIIKQAQEQSKEILLRYEKMLVEIGHYLMDYPVMDEEKLREISAKYLDLDTILSVENYYDFKTIIRNKYDNMLEATNSKKVIKSISAAQLKI